MTQSKAIPLTKAEKLDLYLSVPERDAKRVNERTDYSKIEIALADAGRRFREPADTAKSKTAWRFRRPTRKVILVAAALAILLILAIACVCTAFLSRTFNFNKKSSMNSITLPSGAQAKPKANAPTETEGVGRIFFLSRREGPSQVHMMDTDGSNQTRLTAAEDGVGNFDVSKDGKRIVYAGKAGIYILDAGDSTPTHVSSGENPRLSPDGTEILYSEIVKPGMGAIHIMDSDGSNDRVFDYNGYDPVWSPVGDKIVFFNQFTDDGIKGTARVVATTGALVNDFGVSYPKDYGWSFSPDGNRLVYYSWDKKRLNIGDVATGDSIATILEAPTNSPSGVSMIYVFSPAWSPDNTSICYQRSYSRTPEDNGLWTYDIESGNKRFLTTWYPDGYNQLSWSPDGQQIIMSGDPHKEPGSYNGMMNGNIWTITKNGGLMQLTDTNSDFDPVWR